MFTFQQNISPGRVLTEMLLGIIKTEDDLKILNPLQDQDIADAVVYALGTPERVEVSTKEPVAFHYGKQKILDIFRKNYCSTCIYIRSQHSFQIHEITVTAKNGAVAITKESMNWNASD